MGIFIAIEEFCVAMKRHMARTLLHLHTSDTNQSHTSTLVIECIMLYSHVYLYTEALCLLRCVVCEDHS